MKLCFLYYQSGDLSGEEGIPARIPSIRELASGAELLAGGEKWQRITSEAIIVHVRQEPFGNIRVDINHQTATLQQSDLLLNGLIWFGVFDFRHKKVTAKYARHALRQRGEAVEMTV